MTLVVIVVLVLLMVPLSWGLGGSHPVTTHVPGKDYFNSKNIIGECTTGNDFTLRLIEHIFPRILFFQSQLPYMVWKPT